MVATRMIQTSVAMDSIIDLRIGRLEPGFWEPPGPRMTDWNNRHHRCWYYTAAPMIGLLSPSRSTEDRPETRGPGRPRLLGCLLLLVMGLTGGVQAQTTIELIHFGVGNAFQPGGPIAIRVDVFSDEDEAVPGLIQWELPNPDGDIATNVRRIAVPARGGRTSTWLIGDLPSTATPTDLGREPWFLRLFEYRDGRRIREIATTRIDPNVSQSKPVQQQEGMSLVLGPNPGGLDGYGPMPGGLRPGLNEEMVTVFGVEPGDLPDSWLGLQPYRVIVWAANAPKYSPSIIGNKPSTERALRDWLERGGHLIIMLPATGDPWRIGREETVFGDLLADLKPIRESDYPLKEALPALSDRGSLLKADATMTLHHFDPDTLASPWRPLAGFRPYAAPFDESSVEIPEGTPRAARELLIEQARAAWPHPAEPIIHAVRRDVGQGTLDVVGIDACDQDLRIQQPSLLPRAWVFWNPILGRSAFTAGGEVFRRLDEDRTLARSNPEFLGRGLVSPVIAISGAAASGVLVALVLFAVYWLLAGPLGFSILSRIGLRRHAWVLFTAIGGVFAIIAWLLGLASVGGGRDLRHLTVLTDVYRVGDDAPLTDLDRATCWFSTRLAGYGPTLVSVGDGEEDDSLSFFSPPPPTSSNPFPNASRYEVPFDRQGSYEVPARSTSAEFLANWKGVPVETDGIWESSIKVDVDRPVKVSHDPASGLQVDGVLINACGTDLTDVTLLLTLSRRPGMLEIDPETGLPVLARTVITGTPPNIGVAVSLDVWPAGGLIDLRQAFGAPRTVPSFGRNSLRSELERMFPPPTGAIAGLLESPLTDTDRRRKLKALSIYGILPDPRILVAPGSTDGSWRFIRQMGRSLDISTRTTEPSLIALGFAENVPCPVPIAIDEEPRTGNGDVMLQWIHPLPVDVEALVPLRDERFDPVQEQNSEPDGDPA